MRAAILSRDPFARFVAFGITATILIQAFFNISVVLALVPTKGITLPFVSYGGTSLFIHAGAGGCAAEYHPGSGLKDRVPGTGHTLQGTPSTQSLPMRVVIAGGGTGGHIIPALAIADELKKRYMAEMLFVGTARGLESRLVPQAGYRLELIRVGQLNRVSLATRLRTLVDLPLGFLQCVKLVREFRPMWSSASVATRRGR